MLDQIMTMGSVTSPGLVMRTTIPVIKAAAIMEKLAAGENTSTDPTEYAHLGDWARDLGLRALPGEQSRPCLENFRLGTTSTIGSEVETLPRAPDVAD